MMGKMEGEGGSEGRNLKFLPPSLEGGEGKV